MEISYLKKAGLTEGESKVYLALLKLGSSTTGPIIEKSKISKSIIYQILSKLMEKGLVSYITKEKTKYFQPAQPEKILEYMKEKEKELIKAQDEIEKILPKLHSFQKPSIEGEVKLYLGLKGIRTAYEHIYDKLTRGDKFYFLGISPELSEGQDIYWERDQQRRIKAGIKCKLLFNQGTPRKIIENRNKYKWCQAKIMKPLIKTPAMFMTYKDTTVIILQRENPIAIEIINKDITKSFQEYFDEYWKK